MVSGVFDPLGFLAPLLLKAKIILQELCKLQFGWDDKIPDDIAFQWNNWYQDLEKLKDFKVDRCLKPHGFHPLMVQLHHFSDASETGYGTVSYLWMENACGERHCSFSMGKSRVAPLKQTTIPRLELTAATVAVRTNKMLLRELNIPVDCVTYWTDSMTVLRYIQNSTARFHTFVANRLAVIHEGSQPTDWRYINTKLNPADHASRGISADGVLKQENWVKAPNFPFEPEDNWPMSPSQLTNRELLDSDPEVKKVTVKAVITKSQELKEDTTDCVNKLFQYYSSWYSLKRSVAWILKVRKELLRRANVKRLNSHAIVQGYSYDKTVISYQDLKEAERTILAFIQRQEFLTEINTLESGNSRVSHGSRVRSLDPFLDAGLLRVGGRLHKSSFPVEMKHQVILPKHHHVSTLIIRQIHQDLLHSGRNHVI
ncbi:uncharacterized protein LOC133199821 [Saccostrea echinata]|uniref:uncharacterized protein LOC133199821 n=1 Tax=Saccostrea echinata TaxID=191078 RepID=UPI002A840BD4|nr:uncharacterized protein LOC133199821 [Saccostrea echinata]